MLVLTPEQYQYAMNRLEKEDEPMTDTETNGLQYGRDDICAVQFDAGGEDFYLPFRHLDGPNLELHKLQEVGKVLHEKASIGGYNYKFDTNMHANEGTKPPVSVKDAMIGMWLLNENEDFFKMEYLAKRYIDPTAGDEEDKLLDFLQGQFGGERKKVKKHLHKVSAEIAAGYGCQDVRTTRQLKDFCEPLLEEQGLTQLWIEWCQYAQDIGTMERVGMPIDMDELEQGIIANTERAYELKQEIWNAAGYQINPNSHQQMRAFLGTPATDKDTLHWYKDRPDVKMLLDYRVHAQAERSYYRPYLQFMLDNGLLHPNFNPTGTITGRPTASNPNMLNTPRESSKYSVKRVFIAPPGYTMVELDLSQAEMRIGCHYGQVDNMAKILAEGGDIHQHTADGIGITRQIAKNVNFSANYGIGYRSFSKKYYVPLDKSKMYLAGYHMQYPGFKRLARTAEEFVRTNGYIEFYTGRLGHFNRLPEHEGFHRKCTPAKDAANRLIQGSVSSVMRIALSRVRAEIPEFRTCLTVYDSLLGFVRDEHVDFTIPVVSDILQKQPWCSVPMRVDVKTGKRWSDLKEYTIKKPT